MRITGFTGAVKKDLPVRYFVSENNEPIQASEYGTSFFSNSFDAGAKDIKKYKYLIGIMETTDGKKGACVVPIPKDLTLDDNGKYVYTKNDFTFYVQGFGEFKLYWEWAHEDNRVWVPVYLKKVEDGVTFGDEEYFTETQFDENGNYVGGSVLMLV